MASGTNECIPTCCATSDCGVSGNRRRTGAGPPNPGDCLEVITAWISRLTHTILFLPRRKLMFRKSWIILRLCALLCAVGIISTAHAQQQPDPQDTDPSQAFVCPNGDGGCVDINSARYEALVGGYTGHDEPAILFYSNRRGAGNNLTTVLTLPTDPPTLPQQDGTGGTFNFQLHPAFWFGMVLCDSQSSPNFTHVCNPDTDANIFENPDPNSSRFVGHHPGSAVLELQFYPPGGLNTCSSPTLWCVAMTIDSFNVQDLTNLANNVDCQRRVGLEPVNFAFLTTTGTSQ